MPAQPAGMCRRDFMEAVTVPSLTEFLAARLDEDEAVARATEHNDGPHTLEWRRGGRQHHAFDNHRSEDYESVFAGDWDRILIARDSVRGGRPATHIARHDPARVLAATSAMRAIVALHYMVSDDYLDGDGIERAAFICHECDNSGRPDNWPCPTMRAVAATWSSHPDYQQSWMP